MASLGFSHIRLFGTIPLALATRTRSPRPGRGSASGSITPRRGRASGWRASRKGSSSTPSLLEADLRVPRQGPEPPADRAALSAERPVGRQDRLDVRRAQRLRHPADEEGPVRPGRVHRRQQGRGLRARTIPRCSPSPTSPRRSWTAGAADLPDIVEKPEVTRSERQSPSSRAAARDALLESLKRPGSGIPRRSAPRNDSGGGDRPRRPMKPFRPEQDRPGDRRLARYRRGDREAPRLRGRHRARGGAHAPTRSRGSSPRSRPPAARPRRSRSTSPIRPRSRRRSSPPSPRTARFTFSSTTPASPRTTSSCA